MNTSSYLAISLNTSKINFLYYKLNINIPKINKITRQHINKEELNLIHKTCLLLTSKQQYLDNKLHVTRPNRFQKAKKGQNYHLNNEYFASVSKERYFSVEMSLEINTFSH